MQTNHAIHIEYHNLIFFCGETTPALRPLARNKTFCAFTKKKKNVSLLARECWSMTTTITWRLKVLLEKELFIFWTFGLFSSTRARSVRLGEKGQVDYN